MPTKTPPAGSKGIDDILAEARQRLNRVTPQQTKEEVEQHGAILVDIRPEAQRLANGGSIPGALIIERNVLEWRFDPRCEARLPVADEYGVRIIVYCQEGYTSSLAAAALRDIGQDATDLIGGWSAWIAEYGSGSESAQLREQEGAEK